MQLHPVPVRSPLVHELIASPFLDDYLVLRPGSIQGVRISSGHYQQLQRAAVGQECPGG